MNTVFFDLLDTCVVIYLDDLLIFSKTIAEHKAALDAVFSRLAAHKLYLRPDKCALLLKQVEFLGHVLDTSGVHMQRNKVDAITEWPYPSNVTELQQFLGLCNYYRRFIKSYAKIAAPLTELLRSSTGSFEFGETQRAAFAKLKSVLASAPVLCLFDPSLSSRVLADTSGLATGAVLEQQHPSGWHPVEFYSKRLSSTEANYSATERELLGCMLALARWRPYLIGQTFTLVTDHHPLVYLQTQPKLSRRQARWLDELSQYEVSFVHTPGKQHVAADALSRIPDSSTCAALIGVGDNTMLRRGVVDAQSSSSDEQFAATRALAEQSSGGFSIRNGLVVKLVSDQFVPVIPGDAQELQEAILRELHASALGGHLGRRKLDELVKKRFFWPSISRDVRKFCSECDVCQRSKVVTLAPIGLL